jgi:hypothetical protein
MKKYVIIGLEIKKSSEFGLLYYNVSSAVCSSWVMGEIIIYSFENEPPIDQFLVTVAILV